MRDTIQGTFHFHSTYSHDGRSTPREIVSTLRRRGFSFCVLTDHFEDFDAPKLDRYVRELNEVSTLTGFALIPAIEVNLAGLHTIVFPVREYPEIARLASGQNDGPGRLFKILAHASKYSIESVASHVTRYQLDGIEIWNQQEDGSHMPPIGFLKRLKDELRQRQFRLFFGCDLHDARLTVTNVLSVPSSEGSAVGSLVESLTHGDFVARSLTTGIEFHNGAEPTDFEAWLQTVLEGSYLRGRMLRGVRRSLKLIYSQLPRNARRPLNHFKNFVRNKV